MLQCIAVLYGGLSAEREISLQTGNAVIAALGELGFKVVALDAKDDIVAPLIDAKPDVVFNCLHGQGGEDGKVPALLEHLKLPYTGTGVLGSCLSLDKMRSKRVWQAENVSVLPGEIYTNIEQAKIFSTKVGLPVAVKPVYEGSSVGVTKVTTLDMLQTAIAKASVYGEVMLEPWVDGFEYTVGIIGTTILPSIKIIPGEAFYDYKAKYETKDTQYICPSDLNAKEENEIKNVSILAFRSLGCSSFGRVDLIRNANGEFFVLEVNTVPGLTPTSLVPKAAKQIGWDFKKLVLNILNTAKLEIEAEDSLKRKVSL